jgi:hypothetical protein
LGGSQAGLRIPEKNHQVRLIAGYSGRKDMDVGNINKQQN